jgi:predicted dienelactone hydrolase
MDSARFSRDQLAFLIGVPLACAVLLLFHPTGEGEAITDADVQDEVTRWLVVHLGMMVFIPLMAGAVYLLVRGIESTTGRVSRIALRVAALVAVLTVSAAVPASAEAADVGHRVENLTVPNSVPCPVPNQPCDRKVKVHLWYPANEHGFSQAPKTEYTSALYRRMLPVPWTPLGWKVEAEIARESDLIDPHGRPFPVIVFSHGAVNDPIDYAHALELIAAEGFVVAAPYHANNTQDDVRIDFINAQAGTTLLPCNDGLAAPCSRPSVPNSMQDRVRDISRILNALPDWFGDRVDVSQAGVLGHSRGTVTALAAVGGSADWKCGPMPSPSCPNPELNCIQPKPAGANPPCWPGIEPETRVKAIMGMAIGTRPVTFGANVGNVTVPAVLVAGGRDQNSVQAVSEAAFTAIPRADKLFVAIPNATHRSFDSTYCAQLQSAGANAKNDPNAILDLHTVGLIATSAPGFLSGKAVHYCAPRFFTSPVNIQRVVASTFNAEYFCSGTEPPGLGDQLDRSCSLIPPVAGPSSPCVTTSIPCTGLDTEEVKQGVKEIAVAFFASALKQTGSDGIHFTRYLAPKWLMKHVPMVGSAQAYAGPGSVCPPGQGVICSD